MHSAARSVTPQNGGRRVASSSSTSRLTQCRHTSSSSAFSSFGPKSHASSSPSIGFGSKVPRGAAMPTPARSRMSLPLPVSTPAVVSPRSARQRMSFAPGGRGSSSGLASRARSRQEPSEAMRAAVMEYVAAKDKTCLQAVIADWRLSTVQAARRQCEVLERLHRSRLAEVAARSVFKEWSAQIHRKSASRCFAELLSRRHRKAGDNMLLMQVVCSWSRDSSNRRVLRAEKHLTTERRHVERLSSELAALSVGRDPIAAMDAAAFHGPLSSMVMKDICTAHVGDASETATEAEVEAEPLPADAELVPLGLDSPRLSSLLCAVDSHAAGAITCRSDFLNHSASQSLEYSCKTSDIIKSSMPDLGFKAIQDSKTENGAGFAAGGAAALKSRVEAMIAELQRPPAPSCDQWSPEEEPLSKSPPQSRCPAEDMTAAEAVDSSRAVSDRPSSCSSFKASVFPGRILLRRLAGPRKSHGRRRSVSSSSDSD